MNLEKILANKQDAIAFKRMNLKQGGVMKALRAIEYEDEHEGVLKKTIIGSASMFVDMEQDVVLPSAFNKTIRENAKSVKFLKDHQLSIDGTIGRVTDVRMVPMDVRRWYPESNIATADALELNVEVVREWDPKAYDMYKSGDISSHSYGGFNVKVAIAANDPNYPEEYENWKKYTEKLINPWKAREKGYFWVIQEIKLIEVSAVPVGMNEVTPTIKGPHSPSSDAKEPLKDTPSEPRKSTHSVFSLLY